MKGEYTMSSLLFAIATVMCVIVGLSVFSTDLLITNYPTENVTNFSSLSQMNQTIQMTDNIYYDIQQASETSTLGAIGFAIKGGWDTMRLMFQSLNIFKSFTGDIDASGILPFAIPTWFTILLTIMVTFVIIFAALRFIGKVNI